MNDIELKNKIEAYINEHEREMTDDVIKLCRIPSVRADAEPGMPYGREAYRALMCAKNMCTSYGFRTKEYDGRVISADINRCEKGLDILAHVDVVAPGDGWTVTAPFEPVIRDGALFARGSSDDKGPAAAALYAMRAVSGLGIKLSKNCRLILGSDEECGSSDIPYYYAAEKPAPVTFSPDAEFPLINIEKGQFRGEILSYYSEKTQADGINTDSSELREPVHERVLSELKCGDTINIVPGMGFAKLKGFDTAELAKAAETVKNRINAEFGVEIEETASSASENAVDTPEDEKNKITVITVKGRGAHASTPEGGVNAGIILLNILSELCFDSRALNEKLSELVKMFPYGDFRGEALGIAMSDPESGSTTITPDIFEADGRHISVSFDSRTCIAADEDNTVLKAAELIEERGFSFRYSFVQPHMVSAESEFVKTLLSQYEFVTGKQGKCMAVGGGTYVHDIENGVAFGAVGETTDTHMHGADEFMPISELKQAAVIYAMCIVKLCM